MCCRCGVPQEVVSDNGSNFIRGERELRELVEQLSESQIKQATTSQGVKWSFNPPGAPHFNGVHEVLVQAAKRVMQHVLHKAGLTDEELITAMAGAEDLINSRLLIYQSANGRDLPLLTPNHFLIGQMGGKVAPDSVDTTTFNPCSRWREVQAVTK